jgi:CYTH domain-containing protein
VPLKTGAACLLEFRGEVAPGEAALRWALTPEQLRRLAPQNPETVEIERKYLLSGLPERVKGRPCQEIDQGYLPGARLHERLRRVREGDAEWYVRTVKMGAGVRRAQLEEEADPDLFRSLWPLTEGRRLTKRRYRVSDGGLVWEIDEFTDRELVLAEVELPAPEVVPELPEWLATYVVREVTEEPEYLNVNLAR